MGRNKSFSFFFAAPDEDVTKVSVVGTSNDDVAALVGPGIASTGFNHIFCVF